MNIRLKINKSVHDNAAIYYEEAKETRKKLEGAEKAIEQTKQELAQEEKEEKEKKSAVKVKKERAWHEKFNWFITSGGRLAIGGRNAQQNDMLFSKHMEGEDLFFHADIQGGSAVILKGGANASEQEMLETAQFAASMSNAWKNANAGVDVYAVRKEQVSKHSHGGYIAAGAFAIIGERKWFRNTKLGLKVGIGHHVKPEARDITPEAGSPMPIVLPECSKTKIENEAVLYPSKTGKEKGELAKQLAKRFGAHSDELLQILPNGKSSVKR